MRKRAKERKVGLTLPGGGQDEIPGEDERDGGSGGGERGVERVAAQLREHGRAELQQRSAHADAATARAHLRNLDFRHLLVRVQQRGLLRK